METFLLRRGFLPTPHVKNNPTANIPQRGSLPDSPQDDTKPHIPAIKTTSVLHEGLGGIRAPARAYRDFPKESEPKYIGMPVHVCLPAALKSEVQKVGRFLNIHVNKNPDPRRWMWTGEGRNPKHCKHNEIFKPKLFYGLVGIRHWTGTLKVWVQFLALVSLVYRQDGERGSDLLPATQSIGIQGEIRIPTTPGSPIRPHCS